LHRYVYQTHCGPIPEGTEIHHLDGDKANNAPENLVPMGIKEHKRLHGVNPTPERLAQIRQMQAEGIKKAVAWHTSKKGRAWHSKHAKELHRNMPLIDKVCQMCGEPYQTPLNQKTRSKYCHPNCRAAALRMRLRA